MKTQKVTFSVDENLKEYYHKPIGNYKMKVSEMAKMQFRPAPLKKGIRQSVIEGVAKNRYNIIVKGGSMPLVF